MVKNRRYRYMTPAEVGNLVNAVRLALRLEPIEYKTTFNAPPRTNQWLPGRGTKQIDPYLYNSFHFGGS